MEKLRSSNIIKSIVYIMLPIFIFFLIINSFSIMYYYNYKEEVNTSYYYYSKKFSNNFLTAIYRGANTKVGNNTYVYDAKKKNTITVEQNENEMQNQEEISYEYTLGSKLYDLLIINSNGVAYTNIEKTTSTDSIQELKKYILNKEINWSYDNGEIKTSVSNLEYDNIAYDNRFESIEDKGCAIYASVRDTDSGEMYLYGLMYQIIGGYNNDYAPINFNISIVLVILSIIYIIISIGHKRDYSGIYTNRLDRVPFEIVTILTVIILSIEIFLITVILSEIGSFTTKNIINLCITMSITMGIAFYTTFVTFMITFIRRIKAKMFWNSTLVYKIITSVKSNIMDLFRIDVKSSTKIFLEFLIFLIIQLLLFLLPFISGRPILFIWMPVLWYFIYRYLVKKQNELLKIRKKIKEMYNGDVTTNLNEDELSEEYKQVARELNNISGGLSNAIEEAMKSERLKTELITNVSHDIKTPLTSIINYIDLMKQENIENEKIKEYLDVLDNKSQRLKKLTEDLIEASKASSGNIKLNMEKLNVKELINQIDAEYEEKFKKKELEIIKSIPEEDLYINADSKYMYRVMENIYSNISKYALDNSRVYIDLKKIDEIVKIELKNISKDKLNISVDELMQRFVRGDTSRTTEGSGLGISIAKSLTEIQKGEFEIYLDGDLFKVILEFKTM